MNDPEHARNIVLSVLEFLSSLDQENKEMRSKLQIHDSKLKEISKSMEICDKEPKETTEVLEKLNEENLEFHSKLQICDRKLKKTTKTIEKLSDENTSLSKKVEFLHTKFMEIEDENKHLSSQVERMVKQNEGLIGTLALHIIYKADNNGFSKRHTHKLKENNPSSSSPNDAVQEDVNVISKRVLLHSDTDILSLVTTQSTEIKKLQTDVAVLKNGSQTHGTVLHKLQTEIASLETNGPKYNAGSTYVRWGRNNCSGNGTELVYSGYAAGSDYRDTGAAANYLCLSPDPLWGHYSDTHDADAKVMGVEYELYGTLPGDTTPFFHKNLHNEDAPCSVCCSPRPNVIMIPGRNQCYKGWTLEYKGYLVAGYVGHNAASEYVCLDDNPDVIPGGHANQVGKLFYMVEGRCGSLTCPPYVDGRELTCVVCSK